MTSDSPFGGPAPLLRDDENAELVPFSRPIVKIAGGDLPEIIDQADAILATADRDLFDFGDQVVRPALEPITTFHSEKTVGLRLVPVTTIHLVDRMTRVIDFQKFNKKAKRWVSIDCPNAVAAGYLARIGLRRLRPLAAITTAPVLRRDGTVLELPGYDPTTRILFDPRGVDFLPVPLEPSKEDARNALDELKEPFAEFPFVDDAARSVFLSGLLSVLARPAIKFVPCHAFDAPVAGTGKSKLVDCCAILALGHECPVTSQGDDETELEKRLGAHLLAGDRIIAIDNCDKPLGGQLLCQIITQSLVQVRILGLSKRTTIPCNTSLFATGNNFQFWGDMLRRGLIGRLDAQTERPELRVFKREDPVEVFRRERARFVVAVLTILRAYIAAGCPVAEIMDETGNMVAVQPLGGFEEWSLSVRNALLWLGEPDPLGVIERARTGDPERQTLDGVLTQWEALISDKGFSDPGFMHPEFRTLLLGIAGAGGGVISSTRLGKWLMANKDKPIGDRRLIADGVLAGLPQYRLQRQAAFGWE
jgi:hypothetical protein